MNKPRVEITSEGMIHLTCSQGHVHELDAGESWDLGDDLLIASGTIWQAGTGQPYNPGWSEATGLTDKDFLDERATAILFTDEQMEDLRALAMDRGKTLPQLIREEMLATLAFATWSESLAEPGQDTEGEDGDGHAVPAVDEPVAVTEPVAGTEDHSEDVQQQGKHA